MYKGNVDVFITFELSLVALSLLLALPVNAFALTAQEVWTNGNTAYAQKNYTKALSDYTQLVLVSPNEPEAYYNRGLVKAMLNDKAGALEDYTKAISLRPGHFNAYNNRAALKEDQGNLQGALEDYTKAISLKSDLRRPMQIVVVLKSV